MLVIINDDRAYRSWIARHPCGFVLDLRRRRPRNHPSLHRATCAVIKKAGSKRTHWTTGPHMKACSLDRTELEAWSEEQTGKRPEHCSDCRPGQVVAISVESRSGSATRLTRLADHLLNFVLEVAVIHLERSGSPYDLTVAAAAAELAKTPAQLGRAFEQLSSENYITFAGRFSPGKPPASASIIYPTPRAMRRLPVFADVSEATLQAELDRLRS